MSERFQIIGLTGGIGAGKSAAAARFCALGAKLIDADVLARGALDTNGSCYEPVLEAFGNKIRQPDGRIDRRALARIVFSDEEQRQRLNGIVHPRVIADMLRQAEEIAFRDRTAIAVLDVPLLFECGMDKSVDQSVLVYANDALRIRRVIARDGCAPDDVAARIRAQMPQEEKRRLADYTVNNNGTFEALLGQIDALYHLFRSKLH